MLRAATVGLAMVAIAGCNADPAADADAGDDGTDSGVGAVDGGGTGVDGGGGGADSGGGPMTDAGPDWYPTFERDVVPVLNRSCGSATTGCHDRAAYAPMASSDCRGWLSLVDEPMGGGGCEPRDLYERLVELDAWGCESMDPRVRYVAACEPENSYLFRKIGGGPYCRNPDGTVSQPMPMGATLPGADVELIRQWILAGAPRDGEPRADCSEPPVGNAPVAAIFHPGDGEMRRVGNAIPFTTNATDVEDGNITAAVIVTSDVEGEIGRGMTFSWTPSVLGAQVITATVTDSDGRTDAASITLNIIP
jgi:hypothetical protein